MQDLNICEKLARLLQPNSDSQLTDVVLRLLLNLSFDASLRDSMVKTGLLGV